MLKVDLKVIIRLYKNMIILEENDTFENDFSNLDKDDITSLDEMAEVYPNKVEILCHKAKYFIDNYKQQQALVNVELALSKVDEQVDDDVKLLLQQCVVLTALRGSDKNVAYTTMNKLMLNPKCEGYIRDNMIELQKHCNNPFNNDVVFKLGMKDVKQWVNKIDYDPLNPAIFKFKDQLYVNFRMNDWSFWPTMETETRNPKHDDVNQPNGYFRAKNYLVNLDTENLDWTGPRQLVTKGYKKFRQFEYHGLEDCRFFTWSPREGSDDRLWLIATSHHYHPYRESQMIMAEVDIDNNKILSVQPLTPPPGKEQNTQKNWLPFSYNNKLLFIYLFGPEFIILQFKAKGQCTVFKKESLPLYLENLRGSCPPIEFKDGYLLLTHYKHWLSPIHLRYYSRFIYLDKDLNITKMSNSVYFINDNIEFPTQMLIHNDKLLISMGVDDKEAALIKCDLQDVNDSLIDINEFSKI